MTRGFLSAFLLIATGASAQVLVGIKAEKAVFLEGEPIYFVVEMTNTGAIFKLTAA